MKIITRFFCFSVLLNVSYASSVCMADCNSLLTPHLPSLYEQYCCNSDNIGKTIKLKENNTSLIFVLCPKTLPTSCQKFPTILNCSELFKANSSTPIQSGYFSMQSDNGSQVLVYCNVEDYIDGDGCSQVFQENNAALSGYYKIRFSHHSLILMYCNVEDYIDGYNCSHIFQKNSSTPSGYYTIQAPNGSRISVYCDMEGSNCDGNVGWMRVGYINMTVPNATCPPGLTIKQYNNIGYSICGRPVSSSGSQASVLFSTYGVRYSRVCGQVRGYQFGSPDGFPPHLTSFISTYPNIDGIFVDGISLTFGSSPHKHIWTYVGGIDANETKRWCCPCNTDCTGTEIPSFVGSDYYCESGTSGGWSHILYPDDPLWDGQQCGGLEGPCCTNPKMPWFIKTLDETTTEDIELRMMGSEGTDNEDTPIDILELYIL